jgi:microcystin-dependent protein
MIVQSTTLDTEAKVIAIYGGTSWSKIEGRVLVGDGTLDSTHSYTAGDTGGEAEHTLTVNEMPAHNHALAWFGQAQAGGSGTSVLAGGATPVINSSNRGGSQAHNIMQPYKVVYIWERTA